MPSRITQPSLPEATYHYLGLFGVRARQSDFERAEKLFHQALGRVRRAEDIRAALALDTKRMLPVQLKSPMYERLISLSGRSPRLLREYAQEMYDFGPEFKPYADDLWDEAKQLDTEN